MLQPRISSLILLLSLVLCVVPASAQPAPYCEGEGCPTLYMIEGFEVWLSPSLPDNPAYSHEYLERYLDTVQAQLLFMDSQGVIPPEAMDALRDSGMTIYIDDPDNKQRWWPCGEGTGCYNGALNRIGGLFFGHHTSNVLSYWHEFSFILHEAAHAYHFHVVDEGDRNPCIIEVYERNKHRYERVEKSFRPPEHGIEIGHHYAYTNYAEYFACLTETYFFRNGAYPWNDIELYKHDPEGYYLIKEAWNDPDFCESGFRQSYRSWVTYEQQEQARRETEEQTPLVWAEAERAAAAGVWGS